MGILEKARRIAEANIQELLDASPNPVGAVKRLLIEAEETRSEMVRELKKIDARLDALRERHDTFETSIAHWIERAKHAEKLGRRDLSGASAARFGELARGRDNIARERDRLDSRADWLRKDLERVKQRIPGLKAKRRELEKRGPRPSAPGEILAHSPPPAPATPGSPLEVIDDADEPPALVDLLEAEFAKLEAKRREEADGKQD